MSFLQRHAKIALGYFLVAALLGVLLRWYHVGGGVFNYKYVLHTHSHIALLGWAYLGLTTLLFKAFLEKTAVQKRYRRLFWATQLSLVGMLFSFPFQGYALYSIIFSTLFLFMSYAFAWLFLRYAPAGLKGTFGFRLLRAALWYMVVSSLGPWALGGIMNTLGPASDWYRIAIYFYLHFQYNGWMLLALLGVGFFMAESHGIHFPGRWLRKLWWSLNAGVVLSFFLSVLWTHPGFAVYLLAGLGGLLQCLAIGMLSVWAFQHKDVLKGLFPAWQSGVLAFAGLLLAAKVLLQLLTALPYFADLAVRILDFTIGYLHWTFLGVITLPLFVFLERFKLLSLPPWALWMYVTGFVATEALIFYKGVAAWVGFGPFQGYFSTLTLASMCIPLALIGGFFGRRYRTGGSVRGEVDP